MTMLTEGIFADIVHLDFRKVFDRAPHDIFARAKLYFFRRVCGLF